MDSYHDAAKFLRLLAHPMRLHILDLLRRSDECVCHLSAVFDKPQPYVSQQLAILREAGLTVDRKEGTNVFYALNGGDRMPVLTAVLAALLPGSPADAGPGHTRVAGCCCPKCSAEQ